MTKRALDILVAVAATLLLSPLFVVVVIALRLTGEGEVFYRQERIGRFGRGFGILKFATMLKNSPNLRGGDITTDRDPRILPLGRILRKTKINELPQIFNVLLGDMSFIGPRPLTPRVAGLFPKAHWERIAALRPGLSGVGSIVFSDEEVLLASASDREAMYRDVIAPYKAALEAWYCDHQSLWLDMKLIALTLAVVVFKGIDPMRFLPGVPSFPENLRCALERAKLPAVAYTAS